MVKDLLPKCTGLFQKCRCPGIYKSCHKGCKYFTDQIIPVSQTCWEWQVSIQMFIVFNLGWTPRRTCIRDILVNVSVKMLQTFVLYVWKFIDWGFLGAKRYFIFEMTEA